MSVIPWSLELDSNVSGTHTVYIQDDDSVFQNLRTDVSHYMLLYTLLLCYEFLSFWKPQILYKTIL
jgi:hypothetical protein